MRLIDADWSLEIVRDQGRAHPNAYHLTNYASLILMEGPTVDPVHAAGGCYCRECEQFAIAKVNKKGFLICPVTGMDIGENDFCSFGRRGEDVNEKIKKP